MRPLRLIFPILVLLLLCACTSKENPSLAEVGRIRFDAVITTVGELVPDTPIQLTLSTLDGEYSNTWTDISDISPMEQYYTGRYYAVAVCGERGAEGYGCPCYVDSVAFDVTQNAVTDVALNLRLSQARFAVTLSDRLLAAYPHASATLHSYGHGYIPVAINDPVYLQPGQTSIIVHLDEQLSFTPDLTVNAKAGELYSLALDLEGGGVFTAACGVQSVTVDLDRLSQTPAPTTECIGFDEGVTVSLTEGYPADHPLEMQVTSTVQLRSLSLAVACWPDPVPGIPSQTDLLQGGRASSLHNQGGGAASAPTQSADPRSSSSWLFDHGLKLVQTDELSYRITYNDLIEVLSVGENSLITFTLIAEDIFGRVSGPTVLDVSLETVDLQVESVTDAVIGVNRASVTLAFDVDKVQPSDFSVWIHPNGVPQDIPVLSSSIDSDARTVTLDFAVPEGIAEVPVGIAYMGILKAVTNIGRVVPPYRLWLDPFATTLRVTIIADNPAISHVLTKYASLSVDNADVAILERDPANDLLVCTGLLPSTRYTLSSVIIPGTDPVTADFVTEAARQIPDGDFEDADKSIDYKQLPSGGVYSSTAFPVFNHQNYVDVYVEMPKKHWASINAKTFCTSADNANTWYMQPSAAIDRSDKASGNKSMRITSVGWSIDGPQIEPYVQEAGQFVPYNCNVPPISHVSAGYIYLGDYSFNAAESTETIREGAAFDSRPSSLNGYFKYSPDINFISDRGWVEVELLHEEGSSRQVVARGRAEFSASPSFRSFNLPLTYFVYNLKATRVKILFCSSVASDGLTFDDSGVPVSAIVPEAKCVGSTLWIDNLTFTY